MAAGRFGRSLRLAVFGLGVWGCVAVHGAELSAPSGPPAPPPLEAYGQLPAISALSLSPRGERLAYFGNADGARVLFAVGVDGQSIGAWQLGDLKLRQIRWIGEDFIQVTVSDHLKLGWSGSEVSRDLIVDVRKGSLKPLISKRNSIGITLAHYGSRLIDGRWWSFVKTQFMTTGSGWRGSMLVKVDVETLEIEKLATPNDGYSSWLVDADGRIVANSQFNDHSGNWYLFGGEGIEPELAHVADPTHTVAVLGFGRTTDTVLYKTSLDGEGVRYFEVPLKPAADSPLVPTELLKELTQSVSFVFDPNTRAVSGYWINGDVSELVLLDPVRQGHLKAIKKAFGARTIEFIDWSDDGKRYVVKSIGAQETGSYWLVDIGANKVVKLGDTFPGVAPNWVGDVRTISYKAADGLPLQAILTLPPQREAKALPLVVLPHGGPASRDYPEFNWWAQAYASRGYAVLQPNFRGSSDVSAGLQEAGYGEFGRKMQTDLSDAVAELARLGIADPARVCIVGGSYGGYAALAGVTLQHGLYRCAVSVAGVADLPLHMESVADARGEYLMRYWSRYVGTRNQYDSKLNALSPVDQAAKADAPILLIHGRNDVVVPIEHSEKMRKALQRADKPVEYIELDGEDHWLSRSPTRIAMLKASVAFIEKHNPAVLP